jgi:predicted 3-demethylubiquinone-9 3-methyltransferase (glyoxalase superfamily)
MLGLNGGRAFKHCEAFWFQIVTDTQDETDRDRNALVGNGGQASTCVQCRDRWGIRWRITPRVLTDALVRGGEEASRAFAAVLCG